MRGQEILSGGQRLHLPHELEKTIRAKCVSHSPKAEPSYALKDLPNLPMSPTQKTCLPLKKKPSALSSARSSTPTSTSSINSPLTLDPSTLCLTQRTLPLPTPMIS